MTPTTRHTSFLLGALFLAALLVIGAYNATPKSVKKGEPPERYLFSAKINRTDGVAVSVVVNDATFVQARLDAVEATTPRGLFTVNPTGDLICNLTTSKIDNVEIYLTAFVERTTGAGMAATFVVQGGECIGCFNDPFPQLLHLDHIGNNSNMRLTYNQQLDSLPVPISATGALLPDECFGFMVMALDADGDGNTLTVISGRLNLHVTQ